MFKNKFIAWSPAILFVAILLAAYLGRFNFFELDTATLTINNMANREIAEITVVLYEEPCIIGNLQAGQKANCIFELQSDSHYKISWRESNDRVYREEAGYVTHGFSFEHELEIFGNGEVRFSIKGPV